MKNDEKTSNAWRQSDFQSLNDGSSDQSYYGRQNGNALRIHESDLHFDLHYDLLFPYILNSYITATLALFIILIMES